MFKNTQTNTSSYIKNGKYVFLCEIKETINGKEKRFRYEVEREVPNNLKIFNDFNTIKSKIII